MKLPSLVVQLYDALRHELGANYATTARAKGLSGYQVATRHALRNAMLPIIALLTDLLPALVAGAVVVEVIFALPGMGRLLADAAAAHDFPVLVGGVLLVAVMRLLGLVVADMLYFLTDPRIRLQA
ncbi:ABC transporter permease subunit [Hymenobacter qilianensis]|uniref:ABC transporter permease subunit n=1 Tax=Hymenobacter qilianensis TaxID=1385715 RepID=UPI0021CF6AED|nr:ABC transporter permease [Hymenobacter qilianensis]